MFKVGAPAAVSRRLHRLVGGHLAANLKNVQRRAAFQRRPPGNLEVPAPVSVGPFSVSFRNVQGNRLRRTKQLVLRVAVSGQRLTEPIRPADVLEGDATDVQFLVSKFHADSLPTPIPIPPPIFCRSVLFLFDNVPIRVRGFRQYISAPPD